MYDIVIVGSGIVGSVCALKLAMSTSLNIAILDAKQHQFHFDEQTYDQRVSAISLTSKNIFKNLNIWNDIKSKRISPFARMHVWDHVENSFIEFDAESLFEPELGYIIEDQVIKSCLIDQFKNFSNIDYLCPVTLLQIETKTNHVELTLDDRSILSASLVIGADGAHSFVREALKIPIKTEDYGHTALVATVETEKPHKKTAWQRFTPEGPLAFLPLNHHHFCSIVWSTNHDYAKSLQKLTDEQFKKALGASFNYRLGEICSISKRMYFPLHMRHAKSYVLDHIALIGDAAHTIHPLAGLGLNLGLKDALKLSDVIIDSHVKKRNFGKAYTLRRYERARKSEMLFMLHIVNGLKQLFSSEHKAVGWTRNSGLTLLNRLPFIKKYLAEFANS